MKTESEAPMMPRRLSHLLNRDILCAVALLLLGGVSLSQLGVGVRNWVFPRVLTYILLVAAAVLAVRGIRRWFTPRGQSVRARREEVADVAVFLAIAAAYVLVIPWLGFWLPSLAMLVGSSLFLSMRRSWGVALVSVAVAAGVCILAYVLFLRVFFIPLPAGWFAGLGT